MSSKFSPYDRLPAAQAKMNEWIASGVSLAWLIDAEAESLTIYRPGVPPETRLHEQEIQADSPLAGFDLNLTEIWAGLD